MKVNRLHPNQIIFCPYCNDEKGFNNKINLSSHITNDHHPCILSFWVTLDKPFLKFPNIESKPFNYEKV